MRIVRTSFPRWINAKVPVHQPLRTQGSGVPGALNMRTVSNVKLSHIELFCTSTCSDFHGLLIVLVGQCIAWRKICWNDSGFGPSPLVSCGLWLIHFRSINLALVANIQIILTDMDTQRLQDSNTDWPWEQWWINCQHQCVIFCHQHLSTFRGWNPFLLGIASS